jgi:hypothetical protein
VGRDEHLRLSKSLMDSEVSSIQQGVMMKMGSVDLIVCQESSRDIPYCQVDRGEQVNLDQPEKLTEKMRLFEGLINSNMNLDHHVQLTKEEDQDNILMIGGIGVFLPFAKEEAKICVAGVATTEEQSQLTMTVKEELEQVFETTQAQEEADKVENELSEECLNAFSQEAEEAVALKLIAEEGKESDHSEECLNDFSQEVEEVVALKLTAKGADKEDDEHSEEWLDIFSQEAEKTATEEVVEAEEEGEDRIFFVYLWA